MSFQRHTKEDFLKHGLQELVKKRIYANVCILAAKEALEEGDERAQQALDHYLDERRVINEAIYELKYGGDGPPDQVTHLKPISVTGKSQAKPGAMGLEAILEQIFSVAADIGASAQSTPNREE